MALFSGVNESVWEHMKLLFYPMFIFAIFQSLFFKNSKHFWKIKLRVIILGLFLIPVIYYFYNGAITKSSDWINIMIFVVSIAIAYLYENRLFKSEKHFKTTKKEAIVILIVIAILFGVFTFYPIEIGIFLDPSTNQYGV